LWITILAPSAVLAQSYFPVNWTNASSTVEVLPAFNSLNYMGSATLGYVAGARSVESFAATGNGKVKVNLGSSPARSNLRFFGLATTDPDYNYLSMDYAFYVAATQIRAYAKGSLIAQTTLTAGDISIEKIGTNVIFYVAGIELARRTVSTTNALPYFVDTSFRGAGSWEGIEIDFPVLKTVTQFDAVGTRVLNNLISKTGATSVDGYFVCKNGFGDNMQGVVSYKKVSTQAHSENWCVGLHNSSAVAMPAQYLAAIEFIANGTSINARFMGSIVASSSILPQSEVRMTFSADRIKWSVDGVLLYEQLWLSDGPKCIQFALKKNDAVPIALSDFRINFDAFKGGVVTTSEIDVSNGTINILPLGIKPADTDYVWSDQYISRAQWNTNWTALPAEARAELEPMTYDDIFMTTTSSMQSDEPFSGKMFLVDKIAGTNTTVNYKLGNKPVVKINQAYTFTSNILTKVTGTGNRFELDNGVIVGQTDGIVEFQLVNARGSTYQFGLMPDAATYQATGTHISTGFKSSNINGFFSVLINGVETSIGYMLPGDRLAIEVIKTTVNFRRNGLIIHTGTLPSGGIWRVAAQFNTAGTAKLGIGNTTMGGISKPKKLAIRVTHAKCDGSQQGSAAFNQAYPLFVNGIYKVFRLNENNQYTSAYSGNSYSWSNLMPGEYKVRVEVNAIQVYEGFFSVGYLVEWDVVLGNITTTEQSGVPIFNYTNTLGVGMLKSKNVLFETQPGWISWEYNNIPGTPGLSLVQASLRNTAGAQSSANTTFYPNYNFAIFNTLSNPGCSGYVFGTTGLSIRPYKIKWDQTAASFYRGNWTPSSVCNTSMAEVFRKVQFVFLGNPASIRNVAASFCMSSISEYAELRKALDNGYFLTDEVELPVRYFEEYSDQNGFLDFKIYDKDRAVVLASANSVPVTYGTNYLKIPITELTSGYYIMEVTNSKDEILKLRFKK
jgi:hypothetical protein